MGGAEGKLVARVAMGVSACIPSGFKMHFRAHSISGLEMRVQQVVLQAVLLAWTTLHTLQEAAEAAGAAEAVVMGSGA